MEKKTEDRKCQREAITTSKGSLRMALPIPRQSVTSRPVGGRQDAARWSVAHLTRSISSSDDLCISRSVTFHTDTKLPPPVQTKIEIRRSSMKSSGRSACVSVLYATVDPSRMPLTKKNKDRPKKLKSGQHGLSSGRQSPYQTSYTITRSATPQKATSQMRMQELPQSHTSASERRHTYAQIMQSLCQVSALVRLKTSYENLPTRLKLSTALNKVATGKLHS